MTTDKPPFDKPVPSPCVSVCVLDDNDVCVGCQRTGKEISYWGKMNDDERRAVLQQAVQRAKEQGLSN